MSLTGLLGPCFLLRKKGAHCRSTDSMDATSGKRRGTAALRPLLEASAMHWWESRRRLLLLLENATGNLCLQSLRVSLVAEGWFCRNPKRSMNATYHLLRACTTTMGH